MRGRFPKKNLAEKNALRFFSAKLHYWVMTPAYLITISYCRSALIRG